MAGNSDSGSISKADALEILGVPPGASRRDIKRAYAGLVRKHSPEHDPAGFQRVRAAYECASQTPPADSAASESRSRTRSRALLRPAKPKRLPPLAPGADASGTWNDAITGDATPDSASPGDATPGDARAEMRAEPKVIGSELETDEQRVAGRGLESILEAEPGALAVSPDADQESPPGVASDGDRNTERDERDADTGGLNDDWPPQSEPPPAESGPVGSDPDPPTEDWLECRIEQLELALTKREDQSAEELAWEVLGDGVLDSVEAFDRDRALDLVLRATAQLAGSERPHAARDLCDRIDDILVELSPRHAVSGSVSALYSLVRGFADVSDAISPDLRRELARGLSVHQDNRTPVRLAKALLRAAPVPSQTWRVLKEGAPRLFAALEPHRPIGTMTPSSDPPPVGPYGGAPPSPPRPGTQDPLTPNSVLLVIVVGFVLIFGVVRWGSLRDSRSSTAWRSSSDLYAPTPSPFDAGVSRAHPPASVRDAGVAHMLDPFLGFAGRRGYRRAAEGARIVQQAINDRDCDTLHEHVLLLAVEVPPNDLSFDLAAMQSLTQAMEHYRTLCQKGTPR